MVKHLMALKLKAMMNIVVMMKRKQPQAQAQKVKQECRLSYGLGSYMQLLEEGVHGYATYKASPNDDVDDELTSLVKDLYISASEIFIIYNLCAKLDEYIEQSAISSNIDKKYGKTDTHIANSKEIRRRYI